MQISFNKNIQFTKLLKTEGRLREFNFRKPNSHEEGQVTVDVSNDRGDRIIFHMEKENSNWKIVEQAVPAWVLKNEDNLHEFIAEELRNI
ncbi:MAG TPA: hypothetical protein PLA68_16090 [Panacibacter sp.]|nr:hypothetical protein [Panacibacter sp.]